MATKSVNQLWADADRWLRHWQQVGGIGRPHDWHALALDPTNYAEMRARVGQVGTFAGTEQHNAMLVLLSQLGSPAPVAERVEAPATEVRNPGSEPFEERLRALAVQCGESYEQLLHYATEFAEDGALSEAEVSRLEQSWAKHVQAAEARKAEAISADALDAPPVVEDAKEPGTSG
jgi:hypothetical protein